MECGYRFLGSLADDREHDLDLVIGLDGEVFHYARRDVGNAVRIDMRAPVGRMRQRAAAGLQRLDLRQDRTAQKILTELVVIPAHRDVALVRVEPSRQAARPGGLLLE